MWIYLRSRYLPTTISFYIMESISIPRARDSASHEVSIRESNGSTQSTLRHLSTSNTSDDECMKLRQQFEALQQRFDVCQEIIASLEKNNKAYEQVNLSLNEAVESLEIQLARYRSESEKYKNDRESHRHELRVLCMLFSNSKCTIDAKHQTELKKLQERIITLETDSSHTIRQYLRHVECSDKLCRHIEELNHYISKIDAKFSHLECQFEECTMSLRNKSTELDLLQAQHSEALQINQANVYVLKEDLRHSLRQYLRHIKYSDQLCRQIESLNIYVGEIEARSSHLELQFEECTMALQSKSTELDLLQAQHRDALQIHQANVYTIEADSRHSLRQYLRHFKYSDQLCRQIESLNIYVGEMEAELTRVSCQFEACNVALQSKTTELGLLQVQLKDELQSHQAKVDALQGELQTSKHGIHRVMTFLAELASRPSV